METGWFCVEDETWWFSAVLDGDVGEAVGGVGG